MLGLRFALFSLILLAAWLMMTGAFSMGELRSIVRRLRSVTAS